MKTKAKVTKPRKKKVQEISRIPKTHQERLSLYNELKPIVEKDQETLGLGQDPDA